MSKCIYLLPLILFAVFAFLVVEFGKRRDGIVLIDSEQVKAHFIRSLAKSNIAEDKVTLVTARFKAIFQQTLRDYAKRHSVLVIEKHLVQAGGEDITQEIEHLVGERLSRGKS